MSELCHDILVSAPTLASPRGGAHDAGIRVAATLRTVMVHAEVVAHFVTHSVGHHAHMILFVLYHACRILLPVWGMGENTSH